jgi:hypothetical protein
MNAHQNDDETLASFIKQSTQPRGKGRTKRDDPSPSQKRKNPKVASSEAHATHNRKRKNIAKQTNISSLQLRPLIEFGSCSSASSTAGLAADQVGRSGLFSNWRNLLKKRSFFKHLESKLILEGIIQRQK